MENITITPSRLDGTVTVPSSKSIAHRAIILSGLAKGKSIIQNIDYSKDLNATIRCIEALGAKVQKSYKCIIVDGSNFLKKAGQSFETVMDCGESGTTLRLFIPLSIVKNNSVEFTGRGNLKKRPLDPYYEIFDSQLIEYQCDNEKLDLKIKGRLMPGEFNIRGDISSQFISGLMIALPLLDGDSRLNITTDIQSRGYVDLTYDMLHKFGIHIDNIGSNSFDIKGGQNYKPMDLKLEGDFSQAAFFLAADAIGSQVVCEGLNNASLQGDRAVLNVLCDMGCEIEAKKNSIKACSTGTKGIVIDASQIPDLIPPLAVVASLSFGTTRIINAARLRSKECDRLKALHDELSKLGAKIYELDDGLAIEGREYLDGGVVESWNDHRIAMALAVASTRCRNPVTIRGSDAVNKSYPGFWDDFKSLGGKID